MNPCPPFNPLLGHGNGTVPMVEEGEVLDSVLPVPAAPTKMTAPKKARKMASEGDLSVHKVAASPKDGAAKASSPRLARRSSEPSFPYMSPMEAPNAARPVVKGVPPPGDNESFAMFCAKFALGRHKGVRAIFTEYVVTLDPNKQERFKARVAYLCDEFAREIRRFGIEQRAADRQAERQVRIEEERVERVRRENEEAERRERVRKAAAEKKKKAQAAKRKEEARLRKARQAAMTVVVWSVAPAPAAISCADIVPLAIAAVSVAVWAQTEDVCLITAPVVEMVSTAPTKVEEVSVPPVPQPALAVLPPSPSPPPALRKVLSLEDIFGDSAPTPTLPSSSRSSTSSSPIFSPDSATTSANQRPPLVGGGAQLVTKVDLLDLSSSGDEGDLEIEPLSALRNEEVGEEEAEDEDCDTLNWINTSRGASSPVPRASIPENVSHVFWPVQKLFRRARRFGGDRTNAKE